MLPEVSTQRELARFAKLEGVEPSRLKRPPKPSKIERDRDRIYDWLTVIKDGAELLSKPLDSIATSSTDIAIAVYQHVLRKLDPYGKKIQASPWETLWLERNNPTTGEKNLSKIDQNQAITHWLVDGMFPLEALDEADMLYPTGHHGPGFKDSWLPHLLVVAEEQKYSWARSFVESMVDGTLTGLITALPAENQSEAGLFKLVGLLATASLSTKTNQKYNYLWGVKNDLAVDLRTIIGRYGRGRTGTNTNLDTAVNDILVGSMNELNNRLSVLGVWTMLGSMAVSSAIFRFPKRGPQALIDAAIYAGLGSAAIRTVESGSVRRILEAISGEFGNTVKDITVQSETHETIARISNELVGSRPGVSAMAQKRDVITFLKNIPTSLFVDILPLVATSASAMLVGDSFTSAVFSVGQATRKAVERTSTFMSYKGGQASRMRARKVLVDDLKSLRNSIFGQLTDEALDEWLKGEKVDWDHLPVTLSFKQVGVPPYTRATDGSRVEIVKFEEGFTVKQGDIVPIIGENGTGKTLLMKVLAGEVTGVLENTDISWGDVDVRRMNADRHKRSWKFVSSTEGDSLRELLASALLYKGAFRKHVLSFDIDKENMLKWSKGLIDYPELEQEVSRVLQKWGIQIHASEPWHKIGLRPSGMQRAMANLAFHCLIDEPVNLLIDEAGGELDNKRIDEYIQFLHQLGKSGELPGVVFVAVNKDVGKWMLATKNAYIDTRDDIQGHVMENSIENEELSEQLGMDLAREYHILYELGQPMTPEQFSIWIAYGPGKEFDEHATKILNTIIEKGLIRYNGRLDHSYWIEKSGVMEFESGPYASYLKTCLTTWFEEFANIEARGWPGKKDRITQHLEHILGALRAFYGRDLLVEHNQWYLRNLKGIVIDGNGRWNRQLHEAVFENIIRVYMSGLVLKTKNTIESAHLRTYPDTFDKRYKLLESLTMIEDLDWFLSKYYKESSQLYKPFGDDIDSYAVSLTFITKRRRMDILDRAEPNKRDLWRYIMNDPLILYDIASDHNNYNLTVLQEYFSAVLNKLNREEIVALKARMVEIKLPTHFRGLKIYRSFWHLVNEKHVDGIETGWLRNIFDKRTATLIS